MVDSRYDNLGKMIKPNSSLINDESKLVCSIYRMFDGNLCFASSQDSFRFKKCFYLSFPNNVDVQQSYLDSGTIIPTQKSPTGKFRGLCCNINEIFLNHVLETYFFENITMEQIKTLSEEADIRIVRSLYLEGNAIIDSDSWWINFDNSSDGHVTMSPKLETKCTIPRDCTGKIQVDSLENISSSVIGNIGSWKLSNKIFKISAKAEWREDYFPNDLGWNDVVKTLDYILKFGEIDEFVKVWNINDYIHSNKVGSRITDIKSDVIIPLMLIQEVIESFRCSEACDINDIEESHMISTALNHIRNRIESISIKFIY